MNFAPEPVPEPPVKSGTGTGPVPGSVTGTRTGTVARACQMGYDHNYCTSPPLTSK